MSYLEQHGLVQAEVVRSFSIHPPLVFDAMMGFLEAFDRYLASNEEIPYHIRHSWGGAYRLLMCYFKIEYQKFDVLPGSECSAAEWIEIHESALACMSGLMILGQKVRIDHE